MAGKASEMLNEAGIPFGELIREHRKRSGLSQEQLGSLVGVKKNAVGAWEAGRSRPDVSGIPTLCRALGIPLHVFFGMEEEPVPDRLGERYERLNAYNRQVILKQMDLLYDMQFQEPVRPKKLVRLYQNELSAAAGPVSYLEENQGEMVYLISDEMTKDADEIIRVSGDSMEPTYHDGDQVLIQHVNSLKEGEVGIFISGGSGYIKEYRRDGLYSHNRKYRPIRFSENESVRCVGRVLGCLRKEQRATAEDIALYTEYSL